MRELKATTTIKQVFEEFLADQEDRLSAGTYSKYENIIGLFEHYLESYWPGHSQEEYNELTSKKGTYCGTFGPEEIPDGCSEFLGYFMPHKVICGRGTMQAAGTVTKKLAKWLAEKGYVDAEESSVAQELARAAAHDLPASMDVLDMLEDYLDSLPPDDDYEQTIEDHFWIDRIEPGKLWLEPFTTSVKNIGPVPVPKKITRICEEGWDIGASVAKTRRGWRLIEVWSVAP